MNHAELKAVRCFLLLEQDECAQFIGRVNLRTWQRWEKGEFKLPDDVIESMNDLKSQREKILKYYNSLDNTTIPYEIKESNPVLFKIHLSVICELSAKNQITILIA